MNSWKRITSVLVCSLMMCVGGYATTTIVKTNQYSYGSNAGWLNCRADVDNGAVLAPSYCSGYIYGANIGWINLGDGSPENGTNYSNASATDFGVNVTTNCELRGYAYSANAGWISFEEKGNVRIDIDTGVVQGYAYGANIGWISLSNNFAFVESVLNPATPGGVTASSSGSNVELTWDDAGFATSYGVYRGTTTNVDSAVLLDTVSETTYMDESVAKNTYYYWIKACNGEQNSAFSSWVMSRLSRGLPWLSLLLGDA